MRVDSHKPYFFAQNMCEKAKTLSFKLNDEMFSIFLKMIKI